MSDLTTKVLIEIRDEIKATRRSRHEIKATRDDLRDEIRATNTRLDGVASRLDVVARRQTESEVRVATELVGVRDAVDRVVDLLRTDRSLRGDVDDLKERVANLERKTG